MLNPLNPYTWLLGLALAGSLTLGYFAWRSHERDIGAEPFKAELKTIKAESARVLKIETDKANATTQALKDFKVTQEKQDAVNDQTISILADKLHGLAVAGRLRDPNGCGSSTQAQGVGGAESSQGDGAETSGLLSPELTQFLFAKDKDADTINNAYISCRADERKLRAEWPK